MKSLRVLFISFLLAAFTLIMGCSESSGDDPPVNNLELGFFIDGPVKGIGYTTSSGESGTTGLSGEFRYNTGDSITFSLGTQTLGAELAAGAVITPLDLFQVSSLGDSVEAVNLIRLLLALDTGENAYGLVLPDNMNNLMPDDADLGTMLADNAVFDLQAQQLIETLTGLTIDPSDIPSSADAAAHFEQSEELADLIVSAPEEDNFFVSVKIPSGRSGSVDISYSIEEMPAGVTSYHSGQTTYINPTTSTVDFSEAMYQGNWSLNITQLEDDRLVQVGDILSYYHADGFSAESPTGFPLVIGNTAVCLQADLSSAGAVVTQVHTVSGVIEFPKLLPSGEDVISKTADQLRLSIFYSLEDSGGRPIASFSIHPDLEATPGWTTIDVAGREYYQIDYSTSLPHDMLLEGQIYMFCGDSFDEVTDYELFAFYSPAGPLLSDDTAQNYRADWEEDMRSARSAMSMDQTPGVYRTASGLLIPIH